MRLKPNLYRIYGGTGERLVLPDRIELSTSPLPMERAGAGGRQAGLRSALRSPEGGTIGTELQEVRQHATNRSRHRSDVSWVGCAMTTTVPARPLAGSAIREMPSRQSAQARPRRGSAP